MPVEPPPTRWRFPPVDVADEHGVVARRRRPRARHAPRRLPPGPVPDAGRPRRPDGAGGRPTRAASSRSTASARAVAAAVAAPLRGAGRHGVRRRGRRRAPTPAGPAAGSPTTSARPTSRLHELGWAHSVEAWDDDGLAGGLYGVAIGGLFAGESMFHRRTDASKVALVALVDPPRDGDRPAPRRAVGDRAPRQPRRAGGPRPSSYARAAAERALRRLAAVPCRAPEPRRVATARRVLDRLDACRLAVACAAALPRRCRTWT